jgi:hypothetical protein
MRDETIIRMLQETCDALKGVGFPASARHLVPSYNAVLAAAKVNHPSDPFLGALRPLEDGHEGAGPEEMRILFGQLRIALEALHEDRSRGSAPLTLPARPE